MNNLFSTRTIENIIHNVNCHSLLKDAKSGKYLDVNRTHLDVYGFTNANDMIGKSIWDIDVHMNKMWFDNAKQITDFEAKVIHTGLAVKDHKRVWLNSNGILWQHHMSKIPVFDNMNRISTILSLCEDTTYELSLKELFIYYKSFYKDKTISVQKFLEHINIINYFTSLPTVSETMILINKKTLVHNKLVANKLNIALGTVETHINRLCQKTNTSLLNILSNISGK